MIEEKKSAEPQCYRIKLLSLQYFFDKAKFTTSNKDNTTLYINEESFWYYTAHGAAAMELPL